MNLIYQRPPAGRARIAAMLLASAGLVAIAAMPAPAVAQAAEAERSYDIPAGSLADALNSFAEQSGTQLLYEGELTRGHRSDGLRGRYTRPDALSRLLMSTGLAARQTSAGVFSIARATIGSMQLDPLRVSGAVADGSSQAQEQSSQVRSAPTEGDSSKAATVDDIIVTGTFQNSLTNRLPVTLKELPFTLDVIDREALDQRGFIRSLEAVGTLPNVFVRSEQFGTGSPVFLVRGFIGGTFVNGRPQSGSRGAGARDDSFVDSAEVLKGPTSIAFGPAAPGGVINVLTKSPKATDFVDLNLRAGSFDTVRGELDVNRASLFGSGAVRGRISGAYENSGGPQDEQKRVIYAIRPVVEIDLSRRTRVQLSAAYRRTETREASDFAIYDDGSIPEAFKPSTYFGVPKGNNVGKDTFLEGEVQHEFLDNLKLVVRGSYQDTSFDYKSSSGLISPTANGIARDNPFAYVYASRGSFDTTVQYVDAQLTGNFDAFGSRNDIVVGVTRQRNKEVSTFGFDKVIGIVDVRDPGATVYKAPDFTIPSPPFFLFDTTLQSAYGEAALRPIDGLTVLGGVRYDRVKDVSRNGPDEPAFEQKVDAFTYRIGASYALTRSVNAYVSVAKSFVPQSGQLRGGGLIGPETAINYEIGAKASFASGRLKATAAVFDLFRQNVATDDPANRDGDFFVIATGEQRHRGVEIALYGEVVPRVNVTLGYGYVDARITKANDGTVGRRVGEAPKHTANLFATYDVQRDRDKGLRIGGGVRAISGRPSNVFTPAYTFPGYTVVDALVGYRFSRQVDLQLNILNLLDDRYVEQYRGRFTDAVRFGNPRSAIVSLRTRF